VVSNFASGLVRTVTAQNQGKFTETWDGSTTITCRAAGRLRREGNFMPAKNGPSTASTMPSCRSWPPAAAHGPVARGGHAADKVEGDPVDAPLGDVDVAADGKGTVAFEYLENGLNYFLTDFTRRSVMASCWRVTNRRLCRRHFHLHRWKRNLEF